MLRRELGAAEVARELDVQHDEFRRDRRTLRLRFRRGSVRHDGASDQSKTQNCCFTRRSCGPRGKIIGSDCRSNGYRLTTACASLRRQQEVDMHRPLLRALAIADVREETLMSA